MALNQCAIFNFEFVGAEHLTENSLIQCDFRFSIKSRLQHHRKLEFLAMLQIKELFLCGSFFCRNFLFSCFLCDGLFRGRFLCGGGFFRCLRIDYSLRSGKTRQRHSERRARNIVESEFVAKRD